VAVDAVSDVVEMAQPVPTVVNVMAPDPEPPDALKVIAVPATPVRVVLSIVSGAWFAIVNSKLAAAELFAE
jgi:hypothetical protein